MGNRALKAQATNKNGEQQTVHYQETDSPILPVSQLEHLHSFRPDLVDFVIEQTKKEAEFRRRQSEKVNWFIFVERVLGQLGAVIIAILGVGGGVYAGSTGHEWLGGVIATSTISALAVAFLKTRGADNSQQKPKT